MELSQYKYKALHLAQFSTQYLLCNIVTQIWRTQIESALDGAEPGIQPPQVSSRRWWMCEHRIHQGLCGVQPDSGLSKGEGKLQPTFPEMRPIQVALSEK